MTSNALIAKLSLLKIIYISAYIIKALSLFCSLIKFFSILTFNTSSYLTIIIWDVCYLLYTLYYLFPSYKNPFLCFINVYLVISTQSVRD